MIPEQFLQLLKESLADHQLSRSEKNSLKTWLELNQPDSALVSRLRNAACELARITAATSPDLAPATLTWLEDIVRLLHPQQNSASEVYARAWFSPHDDCPREIRSLIAAARHTIDLCVFTITDDRLTQSVIAAHQRGVRIRIITDNDKAADLGSDADRFRQSGVQLRIDQTQWHMHHKYAVFDQKILLNGSYNWTRGAAEHNEENFLVLNHQPLVSRYQEHFETLWNSLACFENN
ncbi:MAG: phospholipase D-like domain-containing protein [Planctomycetaceae bacterium]